MFTTTGALLSPRNMAHQPRLPRPPSSPQRLKPGQPVIDAVRDGLYSLDSRAVAALLKELSKSGQPQRASGAAHWAGLLLQLCSIMVHAAVCATWLRSAAYWHESDCLPANGLAFCTALQRFACPTLPCLPFVLQSSSTGYARCHATTSSPSWPICTLTPPSSARWVLEAGGAAGGATEQAVQQAVSPSRLAAATHVCCKAPSLLRQFMATSSPWAAMPPCVVCSAAATSSCGARWSLLGRCAGVQGGSMNSNWTHASQFGHEHEQYMQPCACAGCMRRWLCDACVRMLATC